jgi:L-malate glycosyltransferase
LKVLFVNHTAAVSGGEVSLMRLAEGLRSHGGVTVAVACPAGGRLPELVDRAGIERHTLPAFEASLRLHPIRTPMALARLAASGAALRRVARRCGADLLAANSLRAGLTGAIARRLGAPLMVVRAHEHIPLTAVGRSVRGVLIHSAGAVVAVSQDVARRLNQGLEPEVVTFVHNSIDLDRFDPDRVTPAPIRGELGLGAQSTLIGQVAQITPWKGQDTAIRALAELRRTGIDVHLLLIGDVEFGGRSGRHDNEAFLRDLHRLVRALGVRDAVHFLGRRRDVPELLLALDLSMLPSWNEPFGLVTVESMAMGTPPLVSEVGGGPELVEDGVCGRLLPPRRAGEWARAAGELLSDSRGLARMGAKARAVAAKFRDDVQAREMLAVYERVLRGS